MKNDYDVIIVGGGHAGIEAANACAKNNLNTLLISLSINKIGLTPCNPSIGGSAKGIVVREIDALGGLMGKIADKSCLQIKYLNESKGPAVQNLRSQIDKITYPQNALKELSKLKSLKIIEDRAISIIIKNKNACGVKTKQNGNLTSKSVILTTGTYMSSLILKGKSKIESGPDNQITVKTISEQLKEIGFKLIRLKTGTPPRIDCSSINYSVCKIEYGSTNKKLRFQFDNDDSYKYINIPCYLTYTNKNTHQIIKNNLSKSAMFCYENIGNGPRYCPSIEDKIVRFSNRNRHQLFLEPESQFTNSIYLQGLSTSFPDEIQKEIIHTIKGLEKAKILRFGYAIEYDAILPFQLKKTLETKIIENLFIAGQINGTSGYEEAAGQGIIAGINATNKILGRNSLILTRCNSYIGVMIDDLINKDFSEPYRLLTSLAENRLLLRSDNADLRLREIGYKNGLINQNQYNNLLKKKNKIAYVINYLKNNYVDQNSSINRMLVEKNSPCLKTKISFDKLLKRTEINFDNIEKYLNLEIELLPEEKKQIQINIKYENYIKLQLEEIERYKKLKNKKIP